MSQKKKRRSNFAFGIPSGLNNSEMMETTSVFDAVGQILRDEGVPGRGLMPDAIHFQVGMRWVLSLLFFVDAVECWG